MQAVPNVAYQQEKWLNIQCRRDERVESPTLVQVGRTAELQTEGGSNLGQLGVSVEEEQKMDRMGESRIPKENTE